LKTFGFFFRLVEGKGDLEFRVESLVHELALTVNSLVGHCCDFVNLVKPRVGDFEDFYGIYYFSNSPSYCGEF
jgi:hypothetical protein